MTDYDFACTQAGAVATIVTNNWKTTQWIRENVPDAVGTVVGANYATVTGEPRFMLDMAMGLIRAGFTCENHEMVSPQGTC